MNKYFKVDRDTLFYAFRYALGRQTFAPSTVVENIKHNIDNITEQDIQAYIKEIKEQELSGYGMECDRSTWKGLSNYLKEELKKREYGKENKL